VAPGLPRMIAIESLVSYEVIFGATAWVIEEITLERGHQIGVLPPLRNRYILPLSAH